MKSPLEKKGVGVALASHMTALGQNIVCSLSQATHPSTTQMEFLLCSSTFSLLYTSGNSPVTTRGKCTLWGRSGWRSRVPLLVVRHDPTANASHIRESRNTVHEPILWPQSIEKQANVYAYTHFSFNKSHPSHTIDILSRLSKGIL